MQGMLEKLRASLMRFMRGRYGTDRLGLALMGAALVFSVIALWTRYWASIVALILLLITAFRMLSKNIPARQREEQAFLALIAKPLAFTRRRRTMWENRKTKAYVRCPHCHTQFALPKGKGKLRATCPKCGEKSEHTV